MAHNAATFMMSPVYIHAVATKFQGDKVHVQTVYAACGLYLKAKVAKGGGGAYLWYTMILPPVMSSV